jgi:hypothetical protein
MGLEERFWLVVDRRTTLQERGLSLDACTTKRSGAMYGRAGYSGSPLVMSDRIRAGSRQGFTVTG